MPRVALSAADVVNVRHGRAVNGASPNQPPTVALVDDANELVAIAERVNDAWQPRMVLANA
jgi:hypothetical protein